MKAIVTHASYSKEDFNGSRAYRYAGAKAAKAAAKPPKRRSVYFDLFAEIARDQAEWLRGGEMTILSGAPQTSPLPPGAPPLCPDVVAHATAYACADACANANETL